MQGARVLEHVRACACVYVREHARARLGICACVPACVCEKVCACASISVGPLTYAHFSSKTSTLAPTEMLAGGPGGGGGGCGLAGGAGAAAAMAAPGMPMPMGPATMPGMAAAAAAGAPPGPLSCCCSRLLGACAVAAGAWGRLVAGVVVGMK